MRIKGKSPIRLGSFARDKKRKPTLRPPGTSLIWEPSLDPEAARFCALATKLTTEHFAPLAEEIDREQRYPWETVEVFVKAGLSAMFVPTAFGGGGASLTATASVVETVGTGCSSTAAILCAYQLGAFPVLLAGTDEQRLRCLGDLAKGKAASFALSERASGSDAAAIETKAVEERDGFRIQGEKFWVGNGSASQWYVVFAKTDPMAGGRGITAFLVNKDEEGVTIDRIEDKMGIRGTLTSNLKLDVWVPRSAIVGSLGQGMKLALQTLDVGRIMVSAQAVGIAIAGYQEASRRAVERHAFGKPIIDNQGVGFRLADMATEISAARMLLYQAAAAYDAGANVSSLGAMAKLFSSEVSHRAVDAAVQIWGGYGYCKPTKVERLYRDQRIVEIYEGSSEIQRLVLARMVRNEAEAAARSVQK
jgi:alkylation response protein AidB-like acyl-CoA dehydrogenase